MNLTGFNQAQPEERTLLSRENPYPNKISTGKYTILTFLPLNFFHQISKPSTFFFFFTMILLLIPKINPFEPYSYILAFSIIVGVSMIKDAMSDYKRHKSDDIVNKTIVKTVEYLEKQASKPEFKIVEKYCMELKKGDYLLVEKNNEVQADVILLRSTAYHKDKLECTPHCFIQTTNIDGESNLKKRNALCSPKNFPCCSKSKGNANVPRDPNSLCQCHQYFFKNNMSFDLKDTGDSFNDFECDFNIDGKLAIANERNALLRGSILKNTVNSLCLVVGVGSDTKQSKSLYKSKKSRTLFDSRMNFILIVVLLLYAVMLGITMTVGSIFVINNQESPYLGILDGKLSIIKLLISNYVLYTYLIPLSLYVMLEVARFIHAFYVSYDKDMVVEDKVSVCRNSNVIEDLGVIDYILTDKTGTITKNAMTLKHIHKIGDDKLSMIEDLCEELSKELKSNESDGKSATEKIREILYGNDKQRLMIILNMLVCNSVEVLNSELQGISQEELCFLESISKYGFELAERDEDFVVIKILGEKIRINIIGTLEFTSKRQRMCVIVEMLGKYLFFSKGSDLKLLDKNKDSNILNLINSSTDFRCLVMKYKEMSLDKIREFEEKNKIDLENQLNDEQGDIHIEDNLVQKKKQMEEESFKEIEDDTFYIGSTFIEDELQEEVEETMRTFKEAGIKIWMITGDKKETAVACARNSRIIEDDETYIAIDGKNAVSVIEKQIEEDERNKKSRWSKIFKLFDRSDQNLSDQASRSEGENIFNKKSVIVYRATPSQKGKIAAMLVKSGKNTLSIGDGNNDLGMLRISHVGVGIMGKEGTQAALSADFAIPQFKNLRNLLFLHGRYSFLRFTKVALNSYYKNIVFIFVQFLYNLSSCASAFPLYNSFTLNYYNLFFTSMIPFSIALFDRDTNPSLALQRPATYRHIRNAFDRSFVFLNVLFAILEASIIFFAVRLLVFNDITNGSGILGGYTSISSIFSIIVIYTVLLRQIRQISYRVTFSDISICLTILLNVVSVFFIQELYNRTKYTIYYLLTMPYFYFSIFSLCSLIYTVDTLFDNFSIYLEDKIRIKA